MLKEITKKEQVLNKAIALTESEADMALVFLSGMQAQKTINLSNLESKTNTELQEAGI